MIIIQIEKRKIKKINKMGKNTIGIQIKRKRILRILKQNVIKNDYDLYLN